MKNLRVPAGSRVLFAFVCVAGTVAAATSTATESWKPTWLPTSGNTIAYDEARHQTVQLAPTGSGSVDTWVWDGKKWTEEHPQNSPNYNAGAMAYDAIHKQVVVFTQGGSSNSSETWVWDGSNWTQKMPATSPASRVAASMAYDRAHGQIVLFGGANFSGSPIYSDTWIWDGNNWTQKTPQNSPSPRYNTDMAYDEARQQTVLFGGYPDSSDTWIWDGTNWTEEFPQSSPPSIATTACTYDTARRQVVILAFGPVVTETWVWDGSNWTQKTTQHTPPALNAMAYDRLHEKAVMPYSSPQTWDGSDWSPDFPVAPSVRKGHAMASTVRTGFFASISGS